jgi:hypothetical protein
VRRLAVAAGLLAALAAPPASSQPAPASQNGGWRTAAAAALAFGDAEGKMLALRRHSITAAPTTKAAADALLDELGRLATSARNSYLVVERYGSPFWTAAAEIRIGDTFICHAEKIETIPIPPQLAAAAQRLPPRVLDEYLEVLHGIARPLRDQAARVWERAAAKADAPQFVVDRARERLAGATVPDC